LFCPGIGIAVDSCVALIVLFDRPKAESARATLAGVNADSALGSDGSTAGAVMAPERVGPGWLTVGFGGLVGVLSQALSSSAAAQIAINE
jgi:hypothetical protein